MWWHPRLREKLAPAIERRDWPFWLFNRAVRPVLFDTMVTKRGRLLQRKTIAERGRFSSVRLPWSDFVIDRASQHDIYMEKMIASGGYEPGTTRFILGSLEEGDCFVDGGASNGYFSVLASSLVGDAGRVYAFEPSPRNFLRLTRNCRSKFNVTMMPVALWDSDGEAPLFTSGREDGWDSLQDLPWLAHDGNRTVVPTARLDSVIDHRVDILKLDLEGSEEKALRGASKLLERGKIVGCLICEWAPTLMSSPSEYDRRFRFYRSLGKVYDLEGGMKAPVTDRHDLPLSNTNILVALK